MNSTLIQELKEIYFKTVQTGVENSRISYTEDYFISRIEALIKTEQLEARIDELGKTRILSVSGHFPEVTVWSGDKQLKFMERLAELTKQLKDIK